MPSSISEPGPSHERLGRRLRALLVLFVVAVAGCVAHAPSGPRLAPVVPATWRFALDAEPVAARHGMVVSAEPHATRVGVETLERGGNAVDAAVATAFALAVTYPAAGNLGGGGFLVLRLEDGTRAALDFRETAPRAATRDMYLGPTGELTDRSLYGALAAGVPGSVRGLWEAERRYGRLAWNEVVEPARRLAAEGFVVGPALHADLEQLRQRIEGFEADRRVEFAATVRQFLPDGVAPAVGATLRQPDLAATLERIEREGPEGFYHGVVAERIVAQVRAGGGILTSNDLAEYTAEWREPIEFRYREHTVISMPPAASGGATLAEIANILEGYDLAALPFDSAERVHLLVEAMKRGYADRNAYLGDPAFVSMPLARMISDEYAAERRASIRRDAASPAGSVGPGLGPVDRGTETTHLSVVDGAGNAVALTTTINAGFGSLVTVDGAGFLLNNEMDDFAAKPGSPNLYGLVQGEANAIAGGKRMLSSLTPSIVLDPAGRLLFVTGTPGGSRIISVVMQTISNVVDYGMSAAAAVNAPRIHHQHLPDVISVERGGFADATLRELERLGHSLRLVDSLGQVEAIEVSPDGTLTGAADPRGTGLAAGY